mgnify:CR=1 FL=1
MKKLTTLLFAFCMLNAVCQTTHTINAGSYYYNPTQLTIDVGDSVVWINDGGFHDVNGNVNTVTGQSFNNPVTFDSPPTNVVGAVIFSYHFTVPGTYNYDCSVGSHAANGMVGSIVVNPVSNGTTHIVNAGSYYYNPSQLTIDVGDSVIWINDGGYHDVNGDINSITFQPFNNPVTFDSSPTNTVGAVIFSYHFTVPGAYNYDCSVGTHAAGGMVGSIIVNGASSLFENNNQISLFPNPTKNLVNIKSEGYRGIITTKVYNLIGNLVLSTNNQSINLQEYSNGIYLFKVIYGSKTIDLKVVKE